VSEQGWVVSTSSPGEPHPPDADVDSFAALFRAFLERMTHQVNRAESGFIRELAAHLGAAPAGLPVVSRGYPGYDHANVQVALEALFGGADAVGQLVGLTSQFRRHHSLSELIDMSGHGVPIETGSVDYQRVQVSPTETRPCVQFGVWLIEAGPARMAVLQRGPDRQHGQEGVSLEALTTDEEAAETLFSRLEELMVEHNIFRGQVLSFEGHEFGHGAGPIRFLPRPQVSAEDLVLPAPTLRAVQRQVLGIAEQRSRLRAAGLHLKRGGLLYGPPGTGKTLTMRYLLTRLDDHTAIVLAGASLQFITPACALARLLTPAIVVLEDVDLVAEDRSYHGPQPLLFAVLNEMDGMAEDADVTFLLTTNRAGVLEPALAERPGRVDQAVEIPLPDEAGHQRLLELYARGVQLGLADPASILARMRGTTASFVKELVRRSVLAGDGAVRLGDRELHAALDELLDEREAVTRALLGGPARR